jgi:hypothetical protein
VVHVDVKQPLTTYKQVPSDLSRKCGLDDLLVRSGLLLICQKEEAVSFGELSSEALVEQSNSL